MKIVHVLTRGDVLGGAQTHVRELSLELRRLGHEVTVITGAPGIFTDQLRHAGNPVDRGQESRSSATSTSRCRRSRPAMACPARAET
jgi:hypothetical protein